MTNTAKISVLPRTPAAQGDWDDLVQEDRVHRRVYTDQDIFAREMNNIFAATWVYLAHESEIPEPNDFKLAWIGVREVIVARDEAGVIRVFSSAFTWPATGSWCGTTPATATTYRSRTSRSGLPPCSAA